MNFSGCNETGYASDEWAILRAKDEVGVCDTPYLAFQVVASIYLVQEFCILMMAAAAVATSKVRQQQILFVFLFLHGVSAFILVLLGLTKTDFGARNKPGMPLLMTFVLLTFSIFGLQVFKVIVELTGKVASKGLTVEGVSNFNKNLKAEKLLKIMTVMFWICVALIVFCWSVMVNITQQAVAAEWPSDGENKIGIDEFWFRVGCGIFSIAIVAIAFFLLLKISLLKKYVEDAHNADANPETKQFRIKVKRLQQVIFIAGAGGLVIWVAHTFILRFYWYMLFFHLFNSSVIQWLFVYVYAPKLATVGRNAIRRISKTSRAGSRSKSKSSKMSANDP